ncbi:CCHC-type domain-containing protein [Trichonephila clavipes]|nr:CCHC-type domain-containing protein [Trichonephila clavipes]
MAKSRSGRSKKRRFTGNRYTIRATINENDETSELNSTESASAKKLESSHTSLEIFSERLFETSKDNRIVSWTTLISFFAIVCCPDCYSQGLELIEDSVSGLCSHMNLKCKNCPFFKGFPTTEKMKGSCLINSSIVLGLRIIGKGFSAGKKLCAFLGLPFLSKLAFRNQERKLLKATERVAQENINAALSEIKGSNSFTKCGISIDGTWQRRGYSSLNGCVSAISVDTDGRHHGGLGASHLSSSATKLTRGLAAQRLFRIPQFRKGTTHLKASISSPGFEPRPYGTAVSFANHYTGWAMGFHHGEELIHFKSTEAQCSAWKWGKIEDQ